MGETKEKKTITDRMATRADTFGRAKDAAVMTVSQFLVENITPDPNQPRKLFKQETIEELANSIEKDGLIQPIGLRSNPEGNGYIIVAGERRWRAFKHLKKEKISGILLDGDPVVLAIVENLQRENLTPLEEAFALRRLQDERDLKDGEVADLIGKNRRTVNQTLAITRLPNNILDVVDDYPHITKSALIELAQISDEKEQLSTWAALKQGRITVSDVRATRKGEKKESELSPTEKALKAFAGAVKKIEKLETLKEEDATEMKRLQREINKLIKAKTA